MPVCPVGVAVKTTGLLSTLTKGSLQSSEVAGVYVFPRTLLTVERPVMLIVTDSSTVVEG